MEIDNLRVLVVDDMAVYRKAIGDLLREIPGVEVVGAAANGRTALESIYRLEPDLLILDIEMPEMDGLELLTRIKTAGLETGAIVLSALAGDQRTTVAALEQGAFDFVTKPQGRTPAENRQALKASLAPRLRAFARHRQIQRLLRKGQGRISQRSTPPPRPDQVGVVRPVESRLRRPLVPSEVVAIGISTGGPAALARMLSALPADLGAPLLIVQHMPASFTRSLAESLDAKCALQVKEAEDGEFVRPNTVFIAPGERQMKVVPDVLHEHRIIRITEDPPENSCRPSADYLFRSVAHCYGRRATGIVMTGMGADGTCGLKAMKEKGAWIIAQDERSCVVYGMPREVVEAGTADVVAPLEEIAAEICKVVPHAPSVHLSR